MPGIKTTILFTILVLRGSYAAHSQMDAIDSTIVGVWKGTSTCQVQNTSCEDEIVIYYITKAQGVDSFNIMATKIIKDKEEEMGVIIFKLERKSKRLLSNDRSAIWSFRIKNKKMEGTLVYKGSLYRVINLTKQ